jgi:hypothetical protein
VIEWADRLNAYTLSKGKTKKTVRIKSPNLLMHPANRDIPEQTWAA